jgi:hypothetical protein
MYSSVEVLRVLPLNGIAPVGGGGETGQQGFSGAAENKSTVKNRAGGSDFLKCANLKSHSYFPGSVHQPSALIPALAIISFINAQATVNVTYSGHSPRHEEPTENCSAHGNAAQ